MKRYGMSLIEVMIIVTLIGILLLISIPNFTASIDRVRRNTCINSLRQITLAKEQWALENNIEIEGADPSVYTPSAEQLDQYLKEDIWDAGAYTTGHNLICPLDKSTPPNFGTSYTINPLGTNPVCKISGADHKL